MARLSVIGISVVLGLVGCGSANDESAFSEGPGGGFDSGNGDGSGFGSGGPGNGAKDGGANGGAGNVGNVLPTDACATSTAGVISPPISLVFMIDRSQSMGSDEGMDNRATRWEPLVAGLSAFFADPANANVRASVTFFGEGGLRTCDASGYAAPKIPMHALPDAENAFAGVSPGSNTPTLPALQGAITYAKQVQAALPTGEKVAIVLATDGQPYGCRSDVSNVAAAAAAVKSTIPTYVIGVGPSTGNLTEIAVGGGTTAPIMVPTGNPAATSAALRAAAGQIKASQLGCDYTLPSPPAGQTLDVNAVNVNFTPGGGTLSTLPYSADCANPAGWHYDDPAKPAHIVMCEAACSTLRSDTTGGKVDIIFGCSIAAPPGTPLPGGGIK